MRSNYVCLYKKTFADAHGKGKGAIDGWASVGRISESF